MKEEIDLVGGIAYLMDDLTLSSLVPAVCGCAYHEGCYRKVHKKCEGKARTKDIPEYKSPEVCRISRIIPFT